MAKPTTQTNPFATILAELSSTEYKEVSLEYLTHVAAIINKNKPKVLLKTYGEVFDALQFLADNGAVELVEILPDSGSFKIKKAYNG